MVQASLVACAILFALPLAAHAYAGTFSRYMGDDYCASVIFRREGLLAAQKYYYLHWNAVPTTIAMMALTEPGGPALAAWLPLAVLMLWTGTLLWALLPFTVRLHPRAPWLLALVLAEALIFATTEDAPNIIQSLYSRVAMIAYSGPLVAFGVFAGFCFRCADRDRLVRTPWIIGAALWTFIAGNFGPLYAAVQTVAIGAAWVSVAVLAAPPRLRRLSPVLAAGLIGSVAALVVIASAPGNFVRQSRYQAPPDLVGMIGQTTLYVFLMFARPFLRLRGLIDRIVPTPISDVVSPVAVLMSMRSSPLIVVLVASLGAALAFLPQRPVLGRDACRRLLVAIPLIAVAVVAAAMAVGAYGMSAPPPDRALIIPQFAIECLLAVWSVMAATYVRVARPASGRIVALSVAGGLALVVLVVGITMHSTTQTLSRVPSLRAWAQTWTDNDRALRAAASRGEREVTVNTTSLAGGLAWISPYPQSWVNLCVAQYYRLDAVIGH